MTALAAQRDADALHAAERALKPVRADGVVALPATMAPVD